MKTKFFFLFLAILIAGWAAPTIVVVRGFSLAVVSTAHAEDRSVTVKPKKGAETTTAADAKYFAVIIGNQNYKHLPKLKTPIADAKAVNEILKTQYGFETKLLTDAPRKDILSTINDFRKKLSSKDNLLIYYAGHGEFDKTADRAYWLPVDAQRDDPVDWISATDITDNIKRIASKHILIVSDSCYSGTLTRAAAGDLSTKGARDEFIKKMLERPSRTLMASGGNEPVADSGGGNNSVFAAAFLKALKEADKPLFTAEEIFHGRVKTIVAGKSEQVPEYNDIKNSGHEGGDFVFQLAKAMLKDTTGSARLQPRIDDSEAGEAKASHYKEISEEMKKLQEEKARLKSERQELEQQKAIIEEKKRVEEEREKLEKEKTEIAMAAPRKVWEAITGKSYTDPTTGIEMVSVKGGCYQMGCGSWTSDCYDEEKPVHEVCVDDYYMGKYEVTQGQWKAIMGDNPSYFKNCGDNCPVESVSWKDVQDFINKLNQKTGKNYRLPTEAEWEYAARSGGKSEKYSGSNDIDSVAWYDKNSGDKTHPVGTKQPNGLGIYDMSGNVWEWVNDWYDGGYYKNSPKDNPKGPSGGPDRVLRGGSWISNAGVARSAYRYWNYPVSRGSGIGFRLARTQ